ncbi:serine hydrolase [Nannocystis sp. ILAH1]|uniref:serine hydrolase domain-containing protein n=1 Tax=Nannocystis sp. ILAH1 TaxID=2996789 RepID=UPI0022702116|nr:serine hydrolase domain-containing protein [Nannocystis sp. ILAH1]MCY0987698.1 serine hydrolase [Nannocystis sp. ILAH1]
MPRRRATSRPVTFVAAVVGGVLGMSFGSGCHDRPARHDIPAAGRLDPELEGVDDVVVRVMSQLCIGAGVLAVARDGEVLAARGYGYRDGPPSRECAFGRDRFAGGATVEPDTPMRIGSVGKNIGAILLRQVLRDALVAAGLPADDAAIEALPLVGGPLRLLPPRIEETLLGQRAPVFAIGGDCDARADPRWRDVTIGHLLSHRAGLPLAGPDLLSGDRLQVLRELWSREALAAEQAALAPPSRAIRQGPGRDGYFVAPPELAEGVLALGSTCLRSDPGASARYSNLGFDVLSLVAATVSGRDEVARGGDVESHHDSLLDSLLRDELGLTSGRVSRHGIGLSHPYPEARDPAEPRYRMWTPGRRTYYPEYDDPKRPYCILGGDGRCTFDEWRDRRRPVNYAWERRRVPLSYEWIGAPVSTGLLAAEAPVLLELLERYWLGRVMPGGHDDGTPFYGRSRELFDSPVNRQHGGNLGGATAWVGQFVGMPVDYAVVALAPDTGRYDFGAATGTARCTSIPAGVDVVVAFNQSYSQDCHRDSEVCGAAYDLWRSLLIEALCEVDWDRAGAGP